MDVLQVNTYDRGGGAAAVALSLHGEYRKTEEAVLAVGRRYCNELGVVQIEKNPEAEMNKELLAPSIRLGRLSHRMACGHTYRNIMLRQAGRDVLHYPSSRKLLDVAGFVPDVIQCHNLHGHYFDLSALPELSSRAPIVLTLHDCWLLGGHCAHSFDCERWRNGCGDCPDVNIPRAVRRDATAANWEDRRAVFSKFQYRVSAPCRWLIDKAKASLLAGNMLESRVIPNGVDLRTFHPGVKVEARRRLGLDPGAKIVLHVGVYARTSWWRDYGMLEDALAEPDQDITLLCVGEAGEPRQRGRLNVRFVPPVSDRARMADLFRAADIYAHPARQDTFPTTVLEALACGTPVVATAVGGIPEQVDEGRTGYLVPPGDVALMREKLTRLLGDEALLERMAARAAQEASERFDAVKQAKAYLEWFREFA